MARPASPWRAPYRYFGLLLPIVLAGCAGTAPRTTLREAVLQPLPLAAAAPVRELPAQAYLGTDGLDPVNSEYAFDLYLPETASAPLPLVLLIHGGAPAASGLRQAPLMRSWATQIVARAGMAVAVIGWDGHRQRTDQIDAAYARLRAVAPGHGIDPARPCIVTFSAGVAAVVPHVLRSETLAPRCIVGLYGDWTPAVAALSGLDARGLPVLVVRAGADEIVPDTSAPAFVAAARRAGVDVRILRHPHGVHVFEIRNPDARSRRILDRIFDFLRAQAGAD